MCHHTLSFIALLSPAVPELYEDATRKFSAEYTFKQVATIAEPVSRLALSPGNAAFALLESSLQLGKFTLPPPDEKVKEVAFSDRST